MDDMRQLFARPTILAAVGMATVFTAVHNQLMFPITFTYAKEGAPAPILLYLIYALLQVLTCTALFVGRTSIGKTVFANPIRMGIFGAFGVIGTALLIVCGFSTPTSSLCVAFGVALFSLYVPVYFVFWATRLATLGEGTHRSGHIVALDTAFSYVLFCLFTALRLSMGIHASLVGPLYPLAGTLLAICSIRPNNTPQPTFTGVFKVRQLPLNIIVPSMAFIYLCAFIITLLNPITSLSEHPPRRAVLYLLDAILFIVVILLFKRSPNALKRCSMQAFALLSIYLVGAVLLTALGTMDIFDVGNFAVIAGKNAFDALVLILILMNVHTRHVRPEGPAIGYFIFVLLVPHLISALITSEGMLSLDGVTPHGLPVLAFIVVAAFCVSTTVNIILIAFVARTPKTAMSDDAPNAVVPGVLNQVQAAWNLSNREAEIVRLACTAANTARIASTLCIAESTVYTHLKRIYRKAGVHSRQELIDLVETFEK